MDISNVNGILRNSYDHYKNNMIAENRRPVAEPDIDDLDRDGNREERITFSETPSYVLPRAVFMNDKITFDNVWTWVKNNLQRKNISKIFDPNTGEWKKLNLYKQDSLFAWRYHPSVGEKAGGVLSTYDFDPASDADQDIAAALILAHKRWGSDGDINYLAEAKDILDDIWNKETKIINGKRILLAGDTQMYTQDPYTNEETNGVNPSYLRPTYYETLFAEADPEHDWKSLVQPSYEVVQKAADAVMHDGATNEIKGTVNLVPDWIALDATGKVHDHNWVTNDYYSGGDAFRTHMVLALQSTVNPNDKFTKEYFSKQKGEHDVSPYSFFKTQLDKYGTIFSSYKIDGTVHGKENDALPTLGAYMVYFYKSGDLESADKIDSILQERYNDDGCWTGKWGGGNNDDNYYGQNWVWFSYALIAFMNGETFGFGKTSSEKPAEK